MGLFDDVECETPGDIVLYEADLLDPLVIGHTNHELGWFAKYGGLCCTI